MSLSCRYEPGDFISQWLSEVKKNNTKNLLDDPGYYLNSPQSLVTTSLPRRFTLGTGEQVLASIVDKMQSVKHEILFITCFWAKSPPQAALSSALLSLSSVAIAEGRRIRVRIGFSSCSIWQKLTQTSSLSGRRYAPSTWVKILGLPDPSELRGLNLVIRSVFVWPFSVMHSKYVIIDRETLFLPSCNVSWEDWFEGCIELQGDAVKQALIFWERFWSRDESLPPLEGVVGNESGLPEAPAPPFRDLEMGTAQLGINLQRPMSQTSVLHLNPIKTVLLPSPHHRNPRFRPFWSIPPPPPPTPLNLFLLKAIREAKQTIYMQSPNITSYPVISCIQFALQRGVNVKVISNTRMMVIEQLMTAGTLTEWELKKMHAEWLKQDNLSRSQETHPMNSYHTQGNLEILYFDPPDEGSAGRSGRSPTKSHLKLTIIDDEIVVLGSGNMDRASWYTSQELGIAFFSKDLATQILRDAQTALDRQLKLFTDIA